MVNKVIKKEEVSKVGSKSISSKWISSGDKLEFNGNLEIKLIENFVSLQKVMTHLSEKFDGLSNNISKLLELFELSATALAKKDINFTKPMDEEKIMGKLNNILEQNKIIARGMALMGEGAMPERVMPAQAPTILPTRGISPIARGEEKYHMGFSSWSGVSTNWHQ